MSEFVTNILILKVLSLDSSGVLLYLIECANINLKIAVFSHKFNAKTISIQLKI